MLKREELARSLEKIRVVSREEADRIYERELKRGSAYSAVFDSEEKLWKDLSLFFSNPTATVIDEKFIEVRETRIGGFMTTMSVIYKIFKLSGGRFFVIFRVERIEKPWIIP